MGFIDSYKHLEKLCGEMMNDEKKVTAYIDEMSNIFNGSHLVEGWDRDLRKLKHYRYIRNKIVHDPECTEDNMSKPEDVYWLEDFYSRMIKRQDPLSLYYNISKDGTYRELRTTSVHSTGNMESYQEEMKNEEISTILKGVVSTLFIVGVIALLLMLIKLTYF